MQTTVLGRSCKFIPLLGNSSNLRFAFNRFLIEGARGAVLHTGDFRAEPWFLESVRRNPFLQPYLSPPIDKCKERCSAQAVTKTLEAIYLDTACVLSPLEVPTKVPVYVCHISPFFLPITLATCYLRIGGTHETFPGVSLFFYQLLDLGI